MTVAARFAATLVDEWVRSGVTDAVIAPGSRSTPLALAVEAAGDIRAHVILDERSAGFFALGLGVATGRPAIVVTTSGTAAVELHPAIVEADLSCVPMLACTADRPPELHHVGAPQTVEQHGLFGPSVRWATDPGPPRPDDARWWRSLASRAVAEAVAGPRGPGPVHLNLAFREPLHGQPGDLPPGRDGGRPWHQVVPPKAAPPNITVDASRALIVAGGQCGDPSAIVALAEARGWPVLADPRSGARWPARHTVAAADAILRVPSFADGHRPDVVLHVGQPWASRVVNEWLAGCGAEHIVVDRWGRWFDPDRIASTVVSGDPTALCHALAGQRRVVADEAWVNGWARAETAAQLAIDKTLAALGDKPTEPGAARAVVRDLPDGATLFVSSSMPIRDVEWFAAPRTGLRVMANRGANGIDGVVSTALGVSRAATGPTVCLIGDLAFLHDSNGLLAGGDCTFVVVDNAGGGIFSFLPQAGTVERETFERLFATPQRVDVAAVAAAYGVRQVGSMEEGLLSGGLTVVHVRTDRHDNVDVHRALHAAVADALVR